MRRTCRADAKAGHSEPTIRVRCGGRLSDKSYSRDNRLVLPKSPYRRQCSAPRCRLIISWGRRSSQGFGCSPIKMIRELGSDRSGPLFVLEEIYFFFDKVWFLNTLNPEEIFRHHGGSVTNQKNSRRSRGVICVDQLNSYR